MEEYREDLNEEQHGGFLRSRGEKAFERFHRALLSLAAPGDVKRPMMPEVNGAGGKQCDMDKRSAAESREVGTSSQKAPHQFVSGDLSRFDA